MPLANFLDVHEISEADRAQIAEPSFAVVIARSRSGVVLVFNNYRRVWELPGGLIDGGETPRAAAARELAEEAGCVAVDLTWLGLVSVNDGATHFGAVYRCHADPVPADFHSVETGGVDFWRVGKHPLPLGESDRALLRRFG